MIYTHSRGKEEEWGGCRSQEDEVRDKITSVRPSFNCFYLISILETLLSLLVCERESFFLWYSSWSDESCEKSKHSPVMPADRVFSDFNSKFSRYPSSYTSSYSICFNFVWCQRRKCIPSFFPSCFCSVIYLWSHFCLLMSVSDLSLSLSLTAFDVGVSSLPPITFFLLLVRDMKRESACDFLCVQSDFCRSIELSGKRSFLQLKNLK